MELGREPEPESAAAGAFSQEPAEARSRGSRSLQGSPLQSALRSAASARWRMSPSTRRISFLTDDAEVGAEAMLQSRRALEGAEAAGQLSTAEAEAPESPWALNAHEPEEDGRRIWSREEEAAAA